MLALQKTRHPFLELNPTPLKRHAAPATLEKVIFILHPPPYPPLLEAILQHRGAAKLNAALSPGTTEVLGAKANPGVNVATLAFVPMTNAIPPPLTTGLWPSMLFGIEYVTTLVLVPGVLLRT